MVLEGFIMRHPKYTNEQIAHRAERLYEDNIRAEVEPGHIGEYLVIDVDSGGYLIDTDDVAVTKRAAARFPGAPLFIMRIGHPTATRLGGRFGVSGE
jgi:hypothetical protein